MLNVLQKLAMLAIHRSAILAGNIVPLGSFGYSGWVGVLVGAPNPWKKNSVLFTD